MTDLVICLGQGKGTWMEAAAPLKAAAWARIFIITNSFGKERFQLPGNGEFIAVDDFSPIPVMAAAIQKALSGKTSDLEVAVNIVSGSGRAHMAILAALLKLGLGIRLVTASDKGVDEI
jgi:hypothetical protein